MKKVSLLLVLAFMTITLAAQESGQSSGPGRTATFKRNGFFDNWFVGVGPGANIYFGDQDQHASLFGARPSLSVVGQVGKWFNPYFGARIKGTYGSMHSFLGENAERMMSQKNISGQGDILFDVTNYLGRYNENRFYNFILFGGVGGAISFDATISGVPQDRKKKSLTINGGIINRFRVTDRLGIELEFAGAILPDNHDQQVGGDWKYDGLLNTSLSLTYKVGKHGFEEAILADQGLIDGLNDQINKLRQENAILSKRPEFCPKCPEPKPVEQVVQTAEFVSNVVFFRINSAVIDRHQEINIFNTAQFLKENPNVKVRVVGFADRDTGTPTFNLKLSKRRAKNVADALIKKYNISSDRVTVEWKGDTVQPFAINEWNRVAIFYVD